MRRDLSPLLLLPALLCPSGCIQGTPDNREAAEETIKRHVGTKAPTPGHRLDAYFGQKVQLVGYDLSPEEPTPGEPLRLTWHWHCAEELGDGWQIFTHLVDASTDQMCKGGNFDTSSANNLRNHYPPSRWKQGDYVRDVQRIVLPEKLPFLEAEFRVGIYRGNTRLEITKGPHDRQRRARGPRFGTGYEPPSLPELILPRAEGSITIDGHLNEPGWSQAARTEAFVNATDGERGLPRTKARLLYDDTTLYLGFDCDDDNLHSSFTKRDEHLWTQDAVEVFIDPPGRGRDYLEFQVSPAGVIFDTKVHSHPRRNDAYDGHAKAAVQRRGTLNDDSDADRGWTAELAIPLMSLSPRLPQPGQTWRLNLFRLDDRLGGRRAFLAWSTPLANTTHVPARFGRMTFGPLPSDDAPIVDGESPADGGTAPDGEPIQALGSSRSQEASPRAKSQ